MARNMRAYIAQEQHYSLGLQEAEIVELLVDQQGKCWLNIDGICAVRVGNATNIVFKDERKDK